MLDYNSMPDIFLRLLLIFELLIKFHFCKTGYVLQDIFIQLQK
jgi:hypothetical protein